MKPAAQQVTKPDAPKSIAAVVRVPPSTRIRVERIGNNEYRVLKDIYEGEPTRVEVVRENVVYGVAHEEVRLHWLNAAGLNGLGDSGLE